MKIKIFLFVILFSYSCIFAQTEIIIQPDSTEGVDVWVTSVYYEYGRDDYRLMVGGWGDQYFTFIKFNLTNLPSDVESAKIQLYSSPHPDDRFSRVQMYLDKITSDWNESTKWQQRPTFENIGTLPQPVDSTWFEIDITDLYNSWKNGETANNGIQLRPVDVNARMNRFLSSDYSEDPSLRPKLIIKPIYSKELELNTPNGGEKWPVGSEQDVTWESKGIEQINIDISSDNGKSWSSLATGVNAENKSYSWTVEDYTSNECLLRIKDVNDDSFNDETDLNFVIYQPGVTIITHGWYGPNAGTETKISEWVIEMANSIVHRMGGGSIYIHNKQTGNWVSPQSLGYNILWENQNDSNKEIILIYDWVWESNDQEKGWLEAAADNLYASLLLPPKELKMSDNTDIITKPLHFIGHSRGAVLNLETIKRINVDFPDLIIEHYTSLDPHPWSWPPDPGYIDKNNSRITITKNIRWADNYFRRDAFYETDLDFNGVNAIGSFERELNEETLDKDDIEGYASEHSDVHLWYHGTIDTSNSAYDGKKNVPSLWYDNEQMGPRNTTGFNHSRLANGKVPETSIDQRIVPIWEYGSIFNGSFHFFDKVISGPDEIPGWERHGGGGDGEIDTIFGDNRLFLNNDHRSRTHNYLYIPKDKNYFYFYYHVTKAKYNDDDKLQLKSGTDILKIIPITSTTWMFNECKVEIPGNILYNYKGNVVPLTIELTDNNN